MGRLSSGLRINSAADDAAGSAIASKMESQVRSLDVAVRNSYDAISMTQTAEGALGEMENILQRVRELSVQAANSTLSTNDRTQIQTEVNTLIAEVDNIASKTHFNNVKLLDGSNANVTFQIGINANDALAVNLDKSDSTSLGLNGSVGVNELSGERLEKLSYTTNTILAGDIKINGQDALAATFNSDLTAVATNTAKAYADAINANTAVHGAEADAFNNLTSAAIGTFRMDGTITINGNTVENSSSYENLVSNINASVSGVQATLNTDNTVTLSNTNGDDIIIAAGGGTSASVGLTTGTYTGSMSIKNLDGSGVKIEAGSVTNGYTGGVGTLSDVNSFGFNEFSEAGKLETASVSGTALVANEIKINDVLIGESLSGSAYHVASAINESTGTHGVTADANNKVTLTLDFEARPSATTAFKVNGTSVDLRTANSSADFVSAFNGAVVGDLRASTNTAGTIDIKSESGVSIVISNTDNDFITSATNIHGDTINTGLGDGAYDHDGILDGATVAATGIQDLTGGSLHNQVINGRLMLTQQTTEDYTGSSFALTITGKDASGNTITEALTGTNTTKDDDQILGTVTFHTITKITANATMANAFDIGVHSTVATEFDPDSLVTTVTTTAAGDLTLNGALAAESLNNSIVTISNTTDKSGGAITYTVTGKDAFGGAISEAISYNSANIIDTSPTIHGTQAFHTISNIHASGASTSAITIGTMQIGDVVEAKGNLTLSNDKLSAIKVSAVAEDHQALNTSGAATDVILQKLGIQAQGGSFEVTGTGVDVSSLTGANASLAMIDSAIDKISLFRSSFGAVENRIDASINNLTTLKVNTQAAQSRIEDADFAQETSRMTKSQILSQAATSMLAQANASKQNLLALLQ